MFESQRFLRLTDILFSSVLATLAQSNSPKLNYVADPNWPKLPAGWTFEETVDVAVDAREHAFVFSSGTALTHRVR